MLRIKPRALAAASLVLALQLLATVPSAHARPAARTAPAQAGAPSWLAGVMARLNHLLGMTAAVPPPTTDTAGPLTGSCIDPQGTRPCGK
jgi:hypothetical protein